MNKQVAVPEVSGINLDFTPTNYFFARDRNLRRINQSSIERDLIHPIHRSTAA